MNEEQARKLIQDGLHEKVQPLISKMAELISEAYREGIEVGFKIAAAKNLDDLLNQP